MQGAFHSDDLWGGALFLIKTVFKRQREVWGSEAGLFSCHPEAMSFSCGEHRLHFVKNRNVAEGKFLQEKDNTLWVKGEKITYRSQMSKLENESSTWTLVGAQAFEKILNLHTVLMISSCVKNCCLNNTGPDRSSQKWKDLTADRKEVLSGCLKFS